MRGLHTWLAVFVLVLCGVHGALAHVTPPVVLMADREAIVDMLGTIPKVFVREVRLSPAERDLLVQRWHWTADEPVYRFYLGRDTQGQLLAAMTFLTQFTMHGPLRVAVGLRPDGTIKAARVVELTEETFYWVKPLLDLDLLQHYVGHTSNDSFALSTRFTQAGLENMPRFYAEIVASLIQRAAVLYEVTFLRREQQK